MSPDRRVVLAATLAGVGIALVVTLLQPSTYRASGTLVLTREGRAPGDDPTLAPATAAAVELLETRGVAEAVVANLRLDDSPAELLDRIDVDADPQSSLLRVSVDGDAAPGARRIAQEVAEVFTVLYNTRFGPGVTISIWEPPSAAEDRVSPRLARNLLLGALAGALAGLLAGGLRRRTRNEPRPEPGLHEHPEPQLPELGPVVTPPREVEPEPARHVVQADTVPANPVPEPDLEPEPEQGPEPPQRELVLPGPGDWLVSHVELLLAHHGHAFSERREELDVYLESFRQVADAEGRLPAGVEPVFEDVFADLIARESARAPSQ